MASGPCQDIPGGIVSTGISALITCAGNSRTMPQAATALANNLTSAGAIASRTGERGPISVRTSMPDPVNITRIQLILTSRIKHETRLLLGLIIQKPISEEHTSELQSLMRISYA